jgi:hypothetical protein
MLACWHVARFEFQFLSDSKHFEQTNHLPAPRQSHNQKGISNNEQGMSNVEGKRAYKLHHSSFDIPCSIFKNVFPGNYKHEKLGEKFSPENALY